MKKTISIHLQGIPFIIEEDAYQVLNNYLKRLQEVLKNEKGVAEIIQDVELRMVELFTKQLENGKKVIEASGVEEVIGMMGTPDAFGEESVFDFKEKARDSREKLNERRFFRDTETAIVGGVSSGLAGYLGIDVVFIRAIFILLTFLGFFGIPIYLVLWIITPKAKTSYEKLQMRGKPVNLETMKEEIEQASERIQNRTKNFARSLEQNGRLASIFRRIGRIFTILIGIFFLFLASVLLISGFAVLFVGPEWIPIQIDGDFVTLREAAMLVVDEESDFNYVFYGTILVASSLVFGLFLTAIKLLFPIKSLIFRSFSLFLIIAAIAGTLMLFYGGAKIGRSFAAEGEVEREILVENLDELNIHVKRDREKNIDGYYWNFNDDDMGVFQIVGDEIEQFGIKLDFRTSEDNLFRVIQKSSARGRNWGKAQERAKAIKAEIEAAGDSIKIPFYYSYPLEDKIRDQEWKLVVRVPRGKKVFIKGEQVYPKSDWSDTRNESIHGYINSEGEFKSW
ncbi:MAG: hypothetical protein RJA52_854 [Bacteroidota bacterium]|jgi:phage shock protein PspC (stress-responsive transcriptional regulator)